MLFLHSLVKRTLLEPSIAVMLFYDFGTLFTFHPTAPEELAIAVVFLFNDQGLVPSPAAHQSAAIQPIAGLVTLASPCTQRPVVWIELAEIWRLSQVHQVLLCRPLLLAADPL